MFFPDHARLRMLERGVNDMSVLVCLREGMIQRPARIDSKTGELRARMEHFGAARNLSVVVALDDHDPGVLVVTVITRVR